MLEGTTLGSLAARTVGLRVFAVATPSGWRVMPGGLTRVAGDETSPIIAMQRGGRSKDTWVLSDGPVNAEFTLLSNTVTRRRPGQQRRDAAFARGREPVLVRPLRRALRRDGAGPARRPRRGPRRTAARVSARAPAWTLAERLGIVEKSRSAARSLRRAATHREGAFSQRLASLSRVAFSLRDRMSVDHWRTLNRLIGDPALQREPALPMTLVWLDRAITSLMTLSGFVLDGMTRGIGWQFVSIGRRIERLATMCSALQVATVEGRLQELDWLLELADSGVTYRSRYLAAPEWMPVLDMVVRDEANPRSLAFQAKGLADFIARLEASHGGVRRPDPGAGARRACARSSRASSTPRASCSAEVIGDLQRAALARLRRRLAQVLLARGSAQHAGARGMSRRDTAAAGRGWGSPMSDRYTVEHETRYAYRVPVSQSWQLAHLTPRHLPWQKVLRHELRIEPTPDERREAKDAFGNGVTHFGVHGPHPLLRVTMACDVEITDRPDPARIASPAWEEVRAALLDGAGHDDLGAVRMAEPSALVPWSDAARAYAAPSFSAGRPWLEARHGSDAPHPPRVRVRAGRDDRDDVGRRSARAEERRLPGLRPRDDRLPAQPRPGGALRLGLPADRPAAGPAAPARRRCLPRLGRSVFARATAGSSSTRPTTISPIAATSRSPAAPTSPTSFRCAASSSAAEARR